MLKLLGSVAAITAFFTLYGLFHSWLASLSVKNWVRRTVGPAADRWYRLGYNIVAVVTFVPMLLLVALLPTRTLYVVPEPWRWLMIGGQLLALVGAGITLLQTGIFHFLGLTQLLQERPKDNAPLNLRGFYRWVRHPLYTFGLLYLWLTPVMTLNMLTAYILFTLYFYFGSMHEERRLVADFGDEYRAYQAAVPRLIPLPGQSYTPAQQQSQQSYEQII